MREQVLVLPPSVERRQAGFILSKKEEAVLNTSRNWAVEGANAEINLSSFVSSERKQMKILHAELASAAESMKPQDAQGALAESFRGACEEGVKQANTFVEINSTLKRITNSPFPNGEDAPFLQWGPGKRSRCSRSRHHNRGSHEVNNHSIKSSEACLLFCKTVCVQADKVIAVQQNTSCHASEGMIDAKHGVPAEGMWCADKKQSRKASDAKECITGSPSRENRGEFRLHKQEQQLPKPPKDRYLATVRGSNNAGPSKHEFVWPKLFIGLTWKEKEEDYLLIKGTKVPHRPKRRPKVVERALHFCAPGRWLGDITSSQYEVMENKRPRKRPSGLKATQSLDSDMD